MQDDFRVFFDLAVTQTEAEAILHSVEPDAKLPSFYSRREVGCNTVTFGVATCLPDTIHALQQSGKILKSEIINSMRSLRSCSDKEHT